MPKDTTSSRLSTRRHNPFHEELIAHNSVRPKASRPKHRSNDEDDSGNRNDYVDPGLSRKILRMAREQQDELEDEGSQGSARRRSNGVTSPGGSSTGSGFSAMRFSTAEEDEESEEEYDAEEFGEDEYEDVEEVVCENPIP